MSLSADVVLAAALAYAALLFGVAAYAERSHRLRGRGWLNSSLVYTLSISVYCTSWTFYGAVGSAARGGFEFLPIYLGPTLVFVGWWALMRRMVRIGRAQRTTSIADFLSSRYGKSPMVAATVTIIAVIVVLPYISLQLRAIAASFQVLSPAVDADGGSFTRTALWVAAGLALFAIVFGTRNLDANERHHGVVAAIALEAIVKLAALLAVGIFAVWGVAGGVGDVVSMAPESLSVGSETFDTRWAALTFLSAAAVLCLPRQFQVTVVECIDQRHGETAAWLFPLYLFLICLFVAPIAIVGLDVLPAGSNPDLFVLTLPLSQGRTELALLVFLGGFSSATSMVIVSSIALSTMISNHLAMPVALNWRTEGVTGDLRSFLLVSRRISIGVILALGFLYLVWSGGNAALASIGLISFAGVAQFLPALIAGLFWRRASADGALAGLMAGFLVWLATLFAPSLAIQGMNLGGERVAQIFGDDPLVSSLFWSLGANIIMLVGVSLLKDASTLERIQAALFLSSERVEQIKESEQAPLIQRTAAARDLYILAERILGGEAAYRLFEEYRERQGLGVGMPEVDPALIADLERRFAGGVGAASAHALVSQVTSGGGISLEGLMQIADENARLLHYSARLEAQSEALRQSAQELKTANERLKLLYSQQDEFLAQVSHELRTPMTSLCAFSDLLKRPATLEPDRIARFAEIIHQESLRLTRLLDQVLDFGRLERGEFALELSTVDPEEIIDRAITSVVPPEAAERVELRRTTTRVAGAAPRLISADADRIQQVLMNIVSNALKFTSAKQPTLWIESAWIPRLEGGSSFVVLISDNGPGVSPDDAERIFEKFERGGRSTDPAGARGVGLGLAISREIMTRHGGDIRLDAPLHGGATFRIALPAS